LFFAIADLNQQRVVPIHLLSEECLTSLALEYLFIGFSLLTQVDTQAVFAPDIHVVTAGVAPQVGSSFRRQNFGLETSGPNWLTGLVLEKSVCSMKSALQYEYRVKRRVTLVCAALNLLLAGLKLVLGVVGQSQALFADGIHSLSDLASDAMVLVAIRFASDEADEEHPYGHARFETVATVILSLMLLLVAVGIMMDAVKRIAHPELLSQPGFLALSGAAVSIVVNEWMFWYNVRAARQLKSDLMRANAWHHRSDAVSSIIVLIGIAGSMAGFPELDAVGAIGVSLLIGKIGWGLGWAGVRELVDSGATPEQLEEIASTILGVEGVEAFHDLRTRRMGQTLLVEAHVLVVSQVTVSEGHMIGDRVRAKLLRSCEYISEVLVHIDPEDDSTDRKIKLLPGREEMFCRLERRWRDYGIELSVERLNLHYLRGVIDVEILLPLDSVDDLDGARRLSRQLVEATRDEQHIGEVKVLFQ
jgi:cation diffusion facilitator family transporter